MIKRFAAAWFLTFFLFPSIILPASDDDHFRSLLTAAGDKEKYPGANTVIVFDSMIVKVMDSGLSYVTMHKLSKVLTTAGAIELSVQHFDYDPLSAFVEVKSARIFRRTGEVEDIPLDTILDHASPARMIYWGAREKMVPVGRLETGDGLETLVFRKGFTYALLSEAPSSGAASALNPTSEAEDEQYIPPMRGHFYDIVPFWSSVPILLKSYTASLPSDKPLQFEVYNGELASWVHFEGERTVYHWEMKDIRPFESEANMVAASDVAPKLLLSTSPDWIAKSLWFHKVNEDYGSFDVTPEVKAKVEQLTKNCKSAEEKANVLTHWVAEEVRYSGLSMGVGEGYTLHKGGMTFLDRCGVCKDKAGMLVTMLRAAGLESYPAMTMAGSRIDRIPADQFNHSVTIWKRGPDDYVLLDPTWVPGVRELWSSAEQQQQYLMGVPEGADLKTTPISPPENHYFKVRGESELLADGTLLGTITIEAEGQADALLRRQLVRNLKSQWQEYFDRAMYDLSPRTEMIALRYGDPYDISETMQISFQYRIPQYARILGEQMVFTPVVARHLLSDPGSSAYLHMKYDLEKRKYPFATRCSFLIDFQEKVRLPKKYKISDLPKFDAASGEAADFTASYKNEKNTLEFQQVLRMKKRIYPAEEWPNFREAVTAVKKVMEEPVVLTKR
jgi:transglutaminase-like putative cysteine protease